MRWIAVVVVLMMAACGGSEGSCSPDPVGFRCVGGATPYLGQDAAGNQEWMGGYAHGCVLAVNQPSRDYALWVCGN